MKFFYDIKPISEYTYNLKIHGDNLPVIYHIIKKMLKSTHYDTERDTIFFSAEKVTSFKNFILEKKDNKLDTYLCIKMIDDLTKQLIYLKTYNYGYYGFNINDILVIDNIFVFCSTECLLPLIGDNFIFNSPINQPYFSNPEVMKLTTLPSEIDYRCSYYSLGVLLIYCLLKNYLLVGNEIKSTEKIDEIIDPLNNTKIYWFIKRCMDEKIDKRKLLLI
jgi:serine/threonine protein kinase